MADRATSKSAISATDDYHAPHDLDTLGIFVLLDEELNTMRSLIRDCISNDFTPLIADVGEHIFNAGGKYLRPALTLATSRLCDNTTPRQKSIVLSAAVELIHNATLLHDDVVDNSSLRRGRISANHMWGNKPPVLVGDYLFSCAFQLMVKSENLRCLEILAQASSVIASGEILQLTSVNNLDLSSESYFQIIRAKTAALFSAASQVGGVVTSASPEHIEKLKDFGENLGMAFQLVDDILDYSETSSVLGKKRGDDFKDGKVTLPVLLAFQRATDKEKIFWKRCFEDVHQADEDLEHAIDQLKSLGIFHDIRLSAFEYTSKAHDCLLAFPESKVREELFELIAYCTNRKF